MSEQSTGQRVIIEPKAAQIFGIVALVLAIFAIITPFVGLWIGVASCLFAVYPAFTRTGKVWALVVSIVNAANAFFLTPSFWIALGLSAAFGSLDNSKNPDHVREGGQAGSVLFGLAPWIWMVMFAGLFVLVILRYIKDASAPPR